MKKLEVVAPINIFDLSGGSAPGAARKFLNLTLNYGLIRQFFKPDPYDIESGSGEQRTSIRRRVLKLKKELSGFRFSPTTIEACALPEHIKDNGDGTATITFTENPLPVLDGFQRMEALEIIRQEGKGGPTERLVDNLPWPVKISLNPEKRKEDFLNFNNRLSVSRAHILQLSIDTGTIPDKHAKYFKMARDIALNVHGDEESPFYDLIQFDQTSTTPPLNASVLMTNRKTDQIMSFFGSSRLIEIMSKDVDWFVKTTQEIYEVIDENTEAFSSSKLLAFPGNENSRYKAGASFFIGVVNQIVYYMFLKNNHNFDEFIKKKLIKSIVVFDDVVEGDTSSKRRASLMRNFAQSMFKDIVEDKAGKISSHKDIPLPMVAFFSPGSFGVDSPAKPISTEVKSKKGRKSKKKISLGEVQSVENKVVAAPVLKQDTDTDPLFED